MGSRGGVLRLSLCAWLFATSFAYNRLRDMTNYKAECPQVRAIRNFDISELLGEWFVVQYYASSEEALLYRCMRAVLSLSPHALDVTMNFTYSFVDDPINEKLAGNITWNIPEPSQMAHWVHAEDTYEGVYNTYVLDSDYVTFALLLHCADKPGTSRFLSSFIMSRSPELGPNVVLYLREKLIRYSVDLTYMFPMSQADCDIPKAANLPIFPQEVVSISKPAKKHPLKRLHKRTNRRQ